MSRSHVHGYNKTENIKEEETRNLSLQIKLKYLISLETIVGTDLRFKHERNDNDTKQIYPSPTQYRVSLSEAIDFI